MSNPSAPAPIDTGQQWTALVAADPVLIDDGATADELARVKAILRRLSMRAPKSLALGQGEVS
jgi:hypothetical protein